VKLRKPKKSEVRAAEKAARKAAKARASHGSSAPLDVSSPGSDEVEAVQAMYQAALVRTEVADAREHAVNQQAAAVEEREQKLAERLAAVESRERTSAERDAIANDRDLAAVERDRIANDRDRALAERDAAIQEHLVADPADTGDHEIELADLEAKLHRAHLDALTGVFRREMGRLALRNEIERARRGDGRFVIAFIDVDGLKGVNDRDGHAAGDRVLRMLAATMRANLRAYDPIVRFGGDEFVCGIWAIDETEVQHRIGVIDQSLRNATGVGITAGLATLTDDDGLDELTARADDALLAAKRGREN
jgi:diguanylate cyclase (GGDEF)-like protein